VLVTGGAGGIGLQIVQRLHDDGAIVFAIDKNAELIAKLKKDLPKVNAQVVDITDWETTRKVIESFGPLDHLVNNAGVLKTQEFMEISEEVASMHFDVNIKAPINITQTVARGMIAQGNGGTIVNMSSLAGLMTIPGIGMYSASKAAINMLTKTMAVELGPHSIRVNAVGPAAVVAPLANLLPANTGDILGPRLVIKRPIETNEVADTVLFLLSPLSAMITGELITIDGGIMAN